MARWIVILVGALLARTALAHGGVSRTVRLDGPRMVVQADLGAVTRELGLPDATAARRHAPAVIAWMLEGLTVSADGRRCAVEPGSLALSDVVAVHARVACGSGARTLTDATLREAAVGEQTLVLVGDAPPRVLARGHPAAEIDGARGAPATAAAFLGEGVVHLVSGVDHVLFLLCLLFVAGPTARRDGPRAAVGQLARIVTAFTVGHSVTLAAAALDLVVLPSRWVEATIAASIALVAALNVVRPDGDGGHRPALALGFGLVHGFGFSSVLADVGIPAQQRVLALLSFNVGIEVAQLAIVVVSVAPLAWLARHPGAYRRLIMQGGSALIGLVSLYWMAGRIAGS